MTDGGVPVLGDALDHCDDVLLCRGIIVSLGKLRDRRAVPVLIKHLPEVQNRREMVEALGDIGDPAAAEALLERLRRDEYVPVRIAAAKALAKLGDARVAAALVDEAARKEKEATVIAAARARGEPRARTKRGPKPAARGPRGRVTPEGLISAWALRASPGSPGCLRRPRTRGSRGPRRGAAQDASRARSNTDGRVLTRQRTSSSSWSRPSHW